MYLNEYANTNLNIMHTKHTYAHIYVCTLSTDSHVEKVEFSDTYIYLAIFTIFQVGLESVIFLNLWMGA